MILNPAALKSLSLQVARFAPTIASALGGPAAGIALTLLEKALGVPEEKLAEVIATDPTTVIKLRALENQHGENLAVIELKDRLDARQKATAANVSYYWFINVLTIIVIVAFYASFYCVLMIPQCTVNHDILNVMLGILGASYVQVLNLYFSNGKK